MSLLSIPIAFAAACLVAIAISPWMGRGARRIGMVDSPDGRRKHQKQPIPLGGGLAVAIAASIGIQFTLLALASPDPIQSRLVSGMLPAAVVLIAVGLIDDILTLTGIYKFVGQVLAVSILVASGFRFEAVSLLGWHIPFEGYSTPLSMFFCLGAINAFNLLDGADGLAGSVGAVVTLTLGIITWLMGDYVEAVACFAFTGALVGFLRYNLAPAKIYLGDTGSMLIGLVVAAVAINCSIKEQAAFALAVPISVCAIPILDAGAALVRRITTGQSVFTPDRGHLHHALLLRGWSVGRTVAFITGLTAITCLGALASFLTGKELLAIVATLGVVAALAMSRVFGHSELRLIASHLRSAARRIWRRSRLPAANRTSVDTENTVHLQGSREWQNVWQALREAAPVYNFLGLRLNVNAPHLHESFYASWTSQTEQVDDPWRLQLPLRSGGQSVGRLIIKGGASGAKCLHEMQAILDFLEPLELEIERLITMAPAEFPNGHDESKFHIPAKRRDAKMEVGK